MRIRSRIVLSVALLDAIIACGACGGDDSTGTPGASDAGIDATHVDSSTPADATPGDASSSDSASDGATGDASDGGAFDRGPTSLTIDPNGVADPSSVFWDDAKATLFIADNKNNQIWKWTDANGFAKVGTVLDDPAADDAGRTRLGQIVELADGTLVVPRFGFGSAGALLYYNPADGGAGKVSGLDPTLKRTALAIDGNGQLWGGTFVAPGDGKGAVTKLSLSSGESPYALSFQKPVGVVVVRGQLLVSDQTQNTIFALPLDAGALDGGPSDGGHAVFATLPIPDQLAAGPGGSVFTGQFKATVDGGSPQIRWISPDGGVTILAPATQLTVPSGVAYDPTHRRLFVADSNGTTVRTIKILPVP